MIHIAYVWKDQTETKRNVLMRLNVILLKMVHIKQCHFEIWGKNTVIDNFQFS